PSAKERTSPRTPRLRDVPPPEDRPRRPFARHAAVGRQHRREPYSSTTTAVRPCVVRWSPRRAGEADCHIRPTRTRPSCRRSKPSRCPRAARSPAQCRAARHDTGYRPPPVSGKHAEKTEKSTPPCKGATPP